MVCELIYILPMAFIYGKEYGNLQSAGLSMQDLIIKLINSILIIIAFCTIFNFITMLCKEPTTALTICTLLFIVLFVIQAAISPTAHQLPYQKAIDSNGNIIVTNEPNLAYNEFKVKTAKMLYLLNPEGQAMEVYNNIEVPSFLKQLPIYSCGLIIILNTLGIVLFNRKELK